MNSLNSNRTLFIRILNNIWSTGIIPKDWKTANIALILKEGKDLSLPSGYRPVCLLNNWSKILVRLVADRFTLFLENKNMLHPLQFGFRKAKSTVNALNHVILL